MALLIRLCSVLVAISLLAFALRPAERVFDLPVTEDGFYALAVARGFAEGKGFVTQDGTPTNGFQPLFTLIEGAAFWLAEGNDTTAMRLVMGAAWLFHIGGALLIAAFAADAWPGRDGRRSRSCWAALLYLSAPLILNHAYNALETGAVLFFHLAVARWFQLGLMRSAAGAAGGGILAGLLVLTRIDAGVVICVLAATAAWRAWREDGTRGLARSVPFGAVAGIVAAPWFLFNLLHFGSPMPTSGLAQQALALTWTRLEFSVTAMAQVLMPWLFLGVGEQEHAVVLPIPWHIGDLTMTAVGCLRAILLIVAAVALVRYARRARLRDVLASSDRDDMDRPRESLRIAGAMLVGWALLLAYYTFNFTAYWFYYRYFAPFSLFSIVVAAIWLGAAASAARRRATYVLAAGLCIQHGVLLTLAWQDLGYFGQSSYREQVALVDIFVPRFDAVAAGQSGTLGFFRPRVVNLDGKVNHEALGQQAQMTTYLRARGVRWFCDWPHYVNKYLEVPLEAGTARPAGVGNGWRLVAERGDFFLYEDTTQRGAPVKPNLDEAIAMSGRLRGQRRHRSLEPETSR